MKKLVALLLTGALMFGLSAGTVFAAEDPTEGKNMEAVSPDNDMVVATQADATHLDPHVSSNGDSNTITNAMYECLLTFDNDSNVIPCLAKEWSVSDDGLSYTFTLNEGIKFHDGEDFNAESVVAVYERGLADDSLTLQRTISSWESVTADSEYVVTIKLKEPNNTFINKITQFRIVSKAGMDQGKDYLSKNSCGTGPFILEERVDGGYTKLVRNENYWQEGPGVDSLTFKVVPEDGARIAMLQTGEADVITPLPAIDIDRIKDDPEILIHNVPGITYRYVTLNTGYELPDGRKPFADKRVRQALNYAFDSKAYAMVVFNGCAVEPTSIFSEAIMYHHPMTPYTADLEKAKALMEEAGFADGFDVDIIVDNTTVEMKGAEFVKQQLSQINVNVNLLANESTANAEITSASQDETTVQMWYVNWGSGSYEADGSMRSILHSEKFPPEGYNTAFWKNEEFDKLLDDALKMTDTAEIEKAYIRAQEIAWDECPWIFLGNDNTLFAYRSYVSGFMFKPAGELVYRTISLNH